MNELINLINIKPFFKTKNIILYNTDCIDILKQIPDKSIDLVLTDPPYGIHSGMKTGFIARRYNKNGYNYTDNKMISNVNEWDKLPDKNIFDEIFRVSYNQILWGFQYFIEYLKNSKEIWVWDKKTGKSFFADAELAWTSYQGTTRIFQYQWCGCFKPDRTENSVHPTMKPLELFKWCLRKMVKKSLILDCFAGSGTTGIACIELDMKCILIEKEKKYCEIIVDRIKQKQAEIDNKFFIPEKENNLFKGVKC